MTSWHDDLKPEVACFTANEFGERCGSVIFDRKDTSQIPSIAEPCFLAFNARLTITPATNPQDLAAAGSGIKQAVKKYGKTSKA